MTKKMKTITIHPEYDCGELVRYRVGKITNSLEFSPGDPVTKAQAQELCDAKNWNVTIAQVGSR